MDFWDAKHWKISLTFFIKKKTERDVKSSKVTFEKIQN